jgi:tetratricopeptide (TPR) repeat protein
MSGCTIIARGRLLIHAAASLLLALVLAPSVVAQQAPASTLPPEALEAMRKGIIAANGQDYLLAIRYFQDARKTAVDAPEPLFNLGLAESKIPGRELRAICWFAAYLAAAPGTPNVAAVQQQIDVLDVKSEGTITRLITSVQDAAGKLPDADSRNQALSRVIGLWLLSGDSSQAIATSASLDSAWKQKAAKDLHQLSLLTPNANPSPGVSGWANKLGDDPLFLNLAAYLKNQSSNVPQQLFDSMYTAALRLAQTQHTIEQQLRPSAQWAAAVQRDQQEVARVSDEIDKTGRDAQQAHDNEPDWARCSSEKNEPDIAGENERIAACTVVIRSGRTGDDLVRAYWERGAAYARSGRPNQGIPDMDQAIKMNPNNWFYYFNRGFVYCRTMQEEARAMQDYEQALKLATDPEDIRTMQNMIGYAQQGVCKPGH